MKVGGRRAFVVSAERRSAGIHLRRLGLSADDELVFVVDLVSVSGTPRSSRRAAVETDADAQAAAEDRGAPEVVVPEKVTRPPRT